MTDRTTILPVYDFSFSLNETYLKKVTSRLSEHRIAANPINYALLYEYVSENNPELNKTIDTLLTESKTLDIHQSEELYASYICNVSLESFENINRQIRQVLSCVSNAVDDTNKQAEQAGDEFEEQTSLLEKVSDAADLRKIIADVIRETRALATATRAMQGELTRANTEMDALRSELVSVRKMATTDGLTGLLNRHAFYEIMEKVAGTDTSGSVFLCVLDIDFFKRVNDTWGHTIGDKVIKFVASLMQQHTFEHHHVARFGGEELVVIMPDTSRQDAFMIAEKIRTKMQETRLKRKSDEALLGEITVSIGIAEMQPDDTLDSFFNRADAALYKAKRAGRNRVVG